MTMRAKIVRRTLVVILLLPVLAAAAGLLLGPTVLHPFVRRKMTKEQVQQADEVLRRIGGVREDFTVRAQDGVTLRGWKVRTSAADQKKQIPRGLGMTKIKGRDDKARKEGEEKPAPLQPKGAAPEEKTERGNWVLLMHGRSHNRFAMLPHAEFLLAAGYNVVIMDARDHGDSGGTMSTYGYIEKHDATAIVDALEALEKVSHLFALSESMGAAVSLQSAAVEPRIEAVVAEGAFRNLREVMYDYAGLQQSEFLGKTVFRPAADVSRWIAERQGGFSFEQVSPEKAVATPTPRLQSEPGARKTFSILLICGLSDRKIPCRHSRAIYQSAVGKKDLWEVPDTGHEKAIETHRSEFRERVLKFFADVEE